MRWGTVGILSVYRDILQKVIHAYKIGSTVQYSVPPLQHATLWCGEGILGDTDRDSKHIVAIGMLHDWLTVNYFIVQIKCAPPIKCYMFRTGPGHSYPGP